MAIPTDGWFLQQKHTNRVYPFTRELAFREDMVLYVNGKETRNPYNRINKVDIDKRLSVVDSELLLAENKTLRADMEAIRAQLQADRGDDVVKPKAGESQLARENQELRAELERLRAAKQSSRSEDLSEIDLSAFDS